MLETDALAAFLKLEAIRDPASLPPFVALEALHRLDEDHSLRPAEIMFLYRLAGPPRKVRWTYRLQQSLSAQESEAISKIVLLSQRTRFVRFDRYERDEE